LYILFVINALIYFAITTVIVEMLYYCTFIFNLFICFGFHHKIIIEMNIALNLGSP